jgi:micrococcal nuclease
LRLGVWQARGVSRVFRGPSIGALVLLALALGLLLFGGGEDDGKGPTRTGDNGERTRSAEVRTRVTRVVDGDTVEATVGGTVEDIRYIGLDTPESVAPDQPVECFGHRAAEFNRRLVEGRVVRLVFDRERRDRYGRLLAYVYVGDEFVNAALVRRGYARTLTIAPNDRFAPLFARLEQQAGNSGRGLWSAC